MDMISPRKLIGGLGNLMFKEAYIYSQVCDGQTPDLYLQDEKYFERYKNEIQQRFGEGVGSMPNFVSVHVRRGDYVDNPFYINLCETDYYPRAMAMFKDKGFIVFSDDIEWCKQQPMFKDCGFSEETDEVADLNLMASCEHNIIANSSYSWWAAYLNSHPNKIVIAPKQWHPDGIERTKLPESWIRI